MGACGDAWWNCIEWCILGKIHLVLMMLKVTWPELFYRSHRIIKKYLEKIHTSKMQKICLEKKNKKSFAIYLPFGQVVIKMSYFSSLMFFGTLFEIMEIVSLPEGTNSSDCSPTLTLIKDEVTQCVEVLLCYSVSSRYSGFCVGGLFLCEIKTTCKLCVLY